ncbi:MAG: Hpt domain-containing protein [Bacteriovorax sp.]|nr:Hpt domain-containing protein [Bacteriovorax sp.]
MKADTNGNRIHEIEKYFFSQGKNYLDKRFEDLKEIKNTLQDIKDTHRLEKIQKIGHKIKGSAGLYGFSQLSEIGLRLEITAKSGDITKLPNVVDEFQTFLNEAKSE